MALDQPVVGSRWKHRNRYVGAIRRWSVCPPKIDGDTRTADHTVYSTCSEHLLVATRRAITNGHGAHTERSSLACEHTAPAFTTRSHWLPFTLTITEHHWSSALIAVRHRSHTARTLSTPIAANARDFTEEFREFVITSTERSVCVCTNFVHFVHA